MVRSVVKAASGKIVPLGVVLTFVIGTALIIALGFAAPESSDNPYHSPYDVAFAPDGARLAVSDRTAGSVAIVDAASGEVRHSLSLGGSPTGVAWSADGARVFAAEYGEGTVAEIDAENGRIARRFNVGPRPMGLAVAPKRNLLLVANAALGSVSLIDLAGGAERKRVEVSREPVAVAVSPDESLAVVANLLPATSATDPQVAAVVSLIDLEKAEKTADVRLPTGSTVLRDVAVSPDGRWAYAVHTVGRFTLPTTQLDRGWINTNALSIIDLSSRQLYATVLLDLLTEGAADPWGIALARDGRTLWVTLSGVHQIAQIRLGDLHELLAGRIPEAYAKKPGFPAIWREIQADGAGRARLVNDLAALYAAGLIDRRPVPAKGPRGLALAPDGKRLAVAAYFGARVLLIDAENGKATSEFALGPDRSPDPVRLGEMIFHDATFSFQHWLSCATCHPDARADGLNWDLLNDGIGTPKNTRSLVWSDRTPPVMSHGVRANMEVAALAGFRFILFREPEAGELEAVRAYLRSLEPETSPHRLSNGGYSEAAYRGKALFEGKAHCAGCHPAPLYTDLKVREVGMKRPLDQAAEFDTPTLVELWRTGPYLHNGEAVDLKELLTRFNTEDKHGATSNLTPAEIDDVITYLLSL